MKIKAVSGIMLMLFLTLTLTANISESVEAEGIGVYWDSDCSYGVSSIDWGTLNPSSVKNIIVYIQNQIEEPVLLVLSTTNWNPLEASDFLYLDWDYEAQWINPSEVIQITLTLSVSRYIKGISSVTFNAIFSFVTFNTTTESSVLPLSIPMVVFIKYPTWTLDVNPDTLNLKSKGKWITCYIELPKGYDVSDIDRTTILLNDTIPVASFWIDKPLESVIGDYDNDTLRDLMVKFSRKAVSEFILSKGIMYGNVTLTITGELYDGSLFEGSDVIKVGMPSNVNSDDDDECVDIYDTAIPEFPTWTSMLLILITLTFATIIYKRRLLKTPVH